MPENETSENAAFKRRQKLLRLAVQKKGRPLQLKEVMELYPNGNTRRRTFETDCKKIQAAADLLSPLRWPIPVQYSPGKPKGSGKLLVGARPFLDKYHEIPESNWKLAASVLEAKIDDAANPYYGKYLVERNGPIYLGTGMQALCIAAEMLNRPDEFGNVAICTSSAEILALFYCQPFVGWREGPNGLMAMGQKVAWSEDGDPAYKGRVTVTGLKIHWATGSFEAKKKLMLRTSLISFRSMGDDGTFYYGDEDNDVQVQQALDLTCGRIIVVGDERKITGEAAHTPLSVPEPSKKRNEIVNVDKQNYLVTDAPLPDDYRTPDDFQPPIVLTC